MRKLIFALVLLAFACAEDPEPKTISRPNVVKEPDITASRPCPDALIWKVIASPSSNPSPSEDVWPIEIRPMESWANTSTTITFEVKNEGIATFKFKHTSIGAYVTVLPGQTKTFTKLINNLSGTCPNSPIARLFTLTVVKTNCNATIYQPSSWKYTCKAISATNFHTIDPTSSIWGINHVYDPGECW